MVENSDADTLGDPSQDTDKDHGVLVVKKESRTSYNCVVVYDDNAIEVQELALSCSELMSSLVHKR